MVPDENPDLTELFDEAQDARAQEQEVATLPIIGHKDEIDFRLGGPMSYDAHPTEAGRLQVRGCQSCGGYHESVEFDELAKPLSPYTHHFTCPGTGDPVLLALVQGPNGIIDVNVEVLSHLVMAQATGKYMVMIWRIENGQVQWRRVTCDFPMGDFDTAVRQLQESVDYERGVIRRKLPLAAPRNPLRGPLFAGLQGIAKQVLPAGQVVMPPLSVASEGPDGVS